MNFGLQQNLSLDYAGLKNFINTKKIVISSKMPNGEKENRIIGIVSAKGGVGKTTTAINLGAAAVNTFNKSVLVLDTNINTGNLGLNLGLTYHPVSMRSIIKDPISILHSVHKHKSGLHVIPSSLVTEKKKVNTASLRKKLKKLNNYDLILLDSAPGTGDDAQIAMKVADGLLLVVTPDMPAIGTVIKTMEMAKRLKVPVHGVVLNKVKGKKYEITVRNIETALGVPVIAIVPEDPSVQEAVYARMPVVLHKSRAPCSVSFKKLSAKILGKKIKKMNVWNRIALALLGNSK